MPQFVKIGQSVAKILRFFDFQDGRFVWGIFGRIYVICCLIVNFVVQE